MEVTRAVNKRAYRALAAWTGSGRFPHCVLIEGAPGTGREALARTLAGAILCEGGDGARPCGVCRHCVKMEKRIHPDLDVLQGSGGARSFHIDLVREMRKNAVVRPNEASARVFLLLGAQNMTTEAQNALLKIIEEPPRGVHFILICENRAQMLPTILSRCALLSTEEPENAGQAEAPPAQETARETLYDLLRGDELSALERLYAFERDRDGLLAVLSQMREAASGLLPGKGSPDPARPAVTLLRAVRIVDIINEYHAAIRANGNILLLTAAFCARVREIAEG